MASGQQTAGPRGEDFIHWLCDGSLVSDFVFRSPAVKKGKHERELTDILVWFGSAVVVIQIKSADEQAHAQYDADQERRWCQKQAGSALGQVGGAFRALLKSAPTRLENARRGEVSWEPASVTQYFGLALVDHAVVGGVGAHDVFEYGAQKCPSFLLSFNEFVTVLRELSTTPDLLRYLECRALFVQRSSSPNPPELDLLATYKTDPEKFEKSLARGDVPLVPDRAWAEYEAVANVAARREADQPSYFIDRVIDLCHQASSTPMRLGGGYPETTPETSGRRYVDISVELARMNRVERRMFGKYMLDKCHLAEAERRDRYFSVPGSGGLPIVFVASVDSKEDRARSLLALTILAKLRSNTRRAVGIITQPAWWPDAAIEFILLDTDPAREQRLATPEMWASVMKFFPRQIHARATEFPNENSPATSFAPHDG